LNQEKELLFNQIDDQKLKLENAKINFEMQLKEG
jgi:hypothetical protein